MGAYSKTEGTILIALQSVTHGPTALVKGTEIDVSTEISAFLTLYLGYTEATPNTTPPTFHVQGHTAAAGNDGWATIAKFTSAISGTPLFANMTGAPSGNDATTDAHTFTEALHEGKPLYYKDIVVLASSEWHYCQDIPDTTSVFTFEDPVGAPFASGDDIYEAEIFSLAVDLSALARIKVIFQHTGATGANCDILARMNTADSFG